MLQLSVEKGIERESDEKGRKEEKEKVLSENSREDTENVFVCDNRRKYT